MACEGVTIYVDIANTAGPWNGKTPATAWTNITTAVLDQGTNNLISRGGHIVRVATGNYVETILLNTNNSGVAGNPNTFMADGVVTSRPSGGNSIWEFVNASHITVTGFNFTGGLYEGLLLSEGSSNNIITDCTILNSINAYSAVYAPNTVGKDNLIRRCTIRNGGTGLHIRGGNLLTIESCNIMFNASYGIYHYGGRISVKNCIIAGNGIGGYVWVYASAVTNAYNCYFANGSGNVAFYANPPPYTFYNTTDAINGLLNINRIFSNNIVANPNYVGYSSWDFNTFYSNSPCLGGGEGGVNIGRYQDPVIIPTSSNTYFVATTGDDSRSAAQAQSSNTPWRTIGRAASNAIAGDTVSVAAGTYAEAVLITNSGTGQIPVTYRANGLVTVTNNSYQFRLQKVSGVILEGFTCTGNRTGRGIELYLYSMGNTIRNGACHNNSQGIGLNSDWVAGCPGNLISNMRLYNNGSGISCYRSGGTIECNLIYSNSTGISIDGSSAYLQNNNICNNTSHGINTYAYDGTMGLEIRYCTLANNLTNAIIISSSYRGLAYVRAFNCILAGSQYGLREYSATADATIGYAAYSCFSNSVANFVKSGTTNWNSAAEINALIGCSNNIVAEPVLRNVGQQDLRLGGGSPCIDAGALTTDLITDFYGKPRRVGAATDIGSFEMPPAGTFYFSR